MQVMPGGRNRIEELAKRLELDLVMLESCWHEVPDVERAAVIGRIGTDAPGVARLLCPQFQRFSASPGRRAGEIG